MNTAELLVQIVSEAEWHKTGVQGQGYRPKQGRWSGIG